MTFDRDDGVEAEKCESFEMQGNFHKSEENSERK